MIPFYSVILWFYPLAAPAPALCGGVGPSLLGNTLSSRTWSNVGGRTLGSVLSSVENSDLLFCASGVSSVEKGQQLTLFCWVYQQHCVDGNYYLLSLVIPAHVPESRAPLSCYMGMLGVSQRRGASLPFFSCPASREWHGPCKLLMIWCIPSPPSQLKHWLCRSLGPVIWQTTCSSAHCIPHAQEYLWPRTKYTKTHTLGYKSFEKNEYRKEFLWARKSLVDICIFVFQRSWEKVQNNSVHWSSGAWGTIVAAVVSTKQGDNIAAILFSASMPPLFAAMLGLEADNTSKRLPLSCWDNENIA